MLLHIRRFTIAQLDELGARFLAAAAAPALASAFESASATAASAALGQSQAWPSCCAFAVPFPFPLLLNTLFRIHSFVCFALCLGFRLIFAHFPIRLQPFAFCLFPLFPFFVLSLSISVSVSLSPLVFHCSRIRFCWPEPNERMTKTNSPQSELFYGYTICMLASALVSLCLCVCVCCVECGTCCVCDCEYVCVDLQRHECFNAFGSDPKSTPDAISTFSYDSGPGSDCDGHSWSTNLTQLVI